MAVFSLCLILGWIFCFGSAFGSFLNVVVWRLPQRMSLSFPASHCPRCGHPIRWYHNVPILGWFVLHGRCFDCHQPISGRYPTVEFLGGIGFLLLGLADLASVNSESLVHLGLLLTVDWTLFLTFLASSLILWDQNQTPRRLFLPCALVCVLVCASIGPPAPDWTLLEALLETPFFSEVALSFSVLTFLLTRLPHRWRRVGAGIVGLLTTVWVLKFWILNALLTLLTPYNSELPVV